jgi:transketolase
VVLGDGEMAEGQVWEAANFASKHSLDNLIAIVDVNRLGQSEETMFGHHVDEYVSRFNGFGFEATVIDGHDYLQIDKALKDAQENTSGKPYVIIAKTFKGKGVSFLENQDKWHGKALKKEELEKALEELGEVDEAVRFELRKPANVILEGDDLARINQEIDPGQARMTSSFSIGEEIGTREVYGKTLAELALKDNRIYALDGDMKNSTFSEDFKKVYPDRFIECFIAEQNMVSVAVGLSRLMKKPFVSTFASFLVRAADQIRMARISDADIAFIGAHAGVSIGEDGPSQMGLEDLSLFGAIPDSILLQPSDTVSMMKLLPLIA